MTMDGMPPLVLNDVALFVSQRCTCRGTAQAKPVSQPSEDSDHFIAGQRAAIVDPHRSASPRVQALRIVWLCRRGTSKSKTA